MSDKVNFVLFLLTLPRWRSGDLLILAILFIVLYTVIVKFLGRSREDKMLGLYNYVNFLL